ncbi:MAG TPA: HTTM domain-containing protein, partial [Adhaeribacter sp.]|nr:HTTM domain-containing protein [Adhaeribacter sp.]
MLPNSTQKLSIWLTAPVSAAPLALFRVLFGGLMLAATLRFMLKGWVYELYIQPKFFFSYYGFEWVKPLEGNAMYGVFAVLALSAFMVMIGSFYRLSATVFFLTFTYVELLDKSNYLNHYYFVSIVSLLLILVPAHRYFSVDVWRKPELKCTHVPRWTILIFQLQLGLVYFYAGLAKLNYDWLFRAQPLRIWLPAHADFPVIGFLFDYLWVAYFFCWFGALYDLSIPFLLANKTTRGVAYFLVVAFHVMTALLFPIGMFPYVMMLATLIFFPAVFHLKIIAFLQRIFTAVFGRKSVAFSTEKTLAFSTEKVKIFSLKPALNLTLATLLVAHFLFQLVFPFRFGLYPGSLFWTEQGYRFSWRVMLMEKAGTVFFTVRDAKTGLQEDV